MTTFTCTACRTVDNSATSPSYWLRIAIGLPVICTACETGTWHGLFPRRVMVDDVSTSLEDWYDANEEDAA
jgi:hypothetical protein